MPLSSGFEDADFDTAIGSALLLPLLGRDVNVSPREIDFLADFHPADCKSGQWRNGLADSGVPGPGIFDPWGGIYRIRLDGNGDGKLDNPDKSAALEEKIIPGSVAVWSAGEDGDFETWRDNVKSWE